VLILAVAMVGGAIAAHYNDGARAASTAGSHHRASKDAPGAAAAARPMHVPQLAQQSAIARLIAAGHPVYCGGGAKPLVALTFDDGPGPYTRHTLQVLHQHGAVGTFFLVAKEVVGWPALKDVPAEEAAQGAVGDHTYDHVSLPGASAGELQHEVGDAQSVISAATGGRAIRLFRPPYGAHDAALDAEVRSLGMLEILWSVDSGDSRGATADQVLSTVEHDVRPGSIVLLHENRGTTRNALPRLLDDLHRKGFRMVTVPELLALDPPTPQQLAAGSCS